MAGLLRVKIAIETQEGELLAVDDFEVRDDLLDRGWNRDAEQNALVHRATATLTRVYSEAVSK